MYIEPEVNQQIAELMSQAWEQWGRGCGRAIHPDITVQFFVRDRRGDRDNKFTTVLDCLRDAGVIVNDNIASFNGRLIIEPAIVDKDERVVIEVSI